MKTHPFWHRRDTRTEDEIRADKKPREDDEAAKRKWLQTHQIKRLPTMYAWFV